MGGMIQAITAGSLQLKRYFESTHLKVFFRNSNMKVLTKVCSGFENPWLKSAKSFQTADTGVITK